MLTVARGTQAYKGVVFFEALVGRVPYWLWRDGVIPDEIGAYAKNEAPLDRVKTRAQMTSGGAFCMAVPNVFLRLAKLEVPYRPALGRDSAWDGSISAAFDGPVFGQGYYHDAAQTFEVGKAVRWAANSRSCVLLGKGYSGSDPASQGHTAILLPSGYLLQSVMGSGLNWSHTIWQERGYWERGGVMVPPSQWIEMEGAARTSMLAPWAR